jgi:hypothetical protein
MATYLDLAVAWRRQHPKESTNAYQNAFKSIKRRYITVSRNCNHRSHRAAAPSAVFRHQEQERSCPKCGPLQIPVISSIGFSCSFEHKHDEWKIVGIDTAKIVGTIGLPDIAPR